MSGFVFGLFSGSHAVIVRLKSIALQYGCVRHHQKGQLPLSFLFLCFVYFVRFRSKADKPSLAKIDLCPLCPNSCQNVAVPRLSAKCQKATTHRNKKKDRQCSGLSEIRSGVFDQAATRVFRFLRQPSRPNAPRPVAKSGNAAGNGVEAATVSVAIPIPSGASYASHPLQFNTA